MRFPHSWVVCCSSMMYITKSYLCIWWDTNTFAPRNFTPANFVPPTLFVSHIFSRRCALWMHAKYVLRTPFIARLMNVHTCDMTYLPVSSVCACDMMRLHMTCCIHTCVTWHMRTRDMALSRVTSHILSSWMSEFLNVWICLSSCVTSLIHELRHFRIERYTFTNSHMCDVRHTRTQTCFLKPYSKNSRNFIISISPTHLCTMSMHAESRTRTYTPKCTLTNLCMHNDSPTFTNSIMHVL